MQLRRGDVFETLEYKASDGIATIRLNRPEKRNAYNARMMNELVAAFDRSDADDDVGAVILTGSGDAFCAGADLSGGAGTFAQLSEDPERAALRHGGLWRDGGGVASLRIFESLKPVIAAINGPAIGVGATMILACDVRIASDTARFGYVFTQRGLVPEAASSWFLPRIVGLSRALEWTMGACMVAADEALEAGLVRELCARDDLIPRARAIARRFLSGSRVAAALTRQMMWRMAGAAHPMEAHRVDSRAIAALRSSPDTMEAVAAFLQKREANFASQVSDGMPDIWPDGSGPKFY
ncbi:enoyl-CoA hydratase-related protein [Pelagerythrobacter aerophilus]|uniref:Enoyl-CoA hydratase n=1 Tax=Pelagerythrobacter aerophilus TaxID=2306995 RepID=A0A418NDT7_9SPHN|nr:enoyl-CoA hydratase-related protein [Pelagerythrobacter aerophilus]RIV75567.1 enoyl-CoA hydratase [Pelagerythrobacter aerophilus]